MVVLQVVAVFGVDAVEQGGDGEALGLRVGGDFGEHDHGGVAVFIADEIRGEVAVAFFSTEDKEGAVGEAGGAGRRRR